MAGESFMAIPASRTATHPLRRNPELALLTQQPQPHRLAQHFRAARKNALPLVALFGERQMRDPLMSYPLAGADRNLQPSQPQWKKTIAGARIAVLLMLGLASLG